MFARTVTRLGILMLAVFLWVWVTVNPIRFTPLAHALPMSPTVGDILLVDDDDNSPDVQDYYTYALDQLGVSYTVWDTAVSDNEPLLADMQPYDMVIWFTGDYFGTYAGPSAATEYDLEWWLNEGNCFFISSEDYHYARGLTGFMVGYLGVESITDDAGNYTAVTGQDSFSYLGTYPLVYPVADYSDIITPTYIVPTEVIFTGNNGYNAAIARNTGLYQTTYWAFPFEAIATDAARVTSMAAVMDWCGISLATGQLDGFVHSALTGSSLYMATVTADNGSTQFATTTDDGGYFNMFLPTGTYTVWAEYPGYQPTTITNVDIMTDVVRTVTLTLDAGVLDYFPTSLDVNVPLGETWQESLQLSNIGTAPLVFSLVDRAMGSYLDPVRLPASDGNFPRGTAVPSTAPAPKPNAPFPAPNPQLPLNITAYAIDTVEPQLGHFDLGQPAAWNTVQTYTTTSYYAGDFIGGDFSTLYVLDYDSNQLFALDTNTGHPTFIEDAIPLSGESWTGMTGAVSGVMYASSTNISRSTLYTINLTNGQAVPIGEITGAPCIIDIAINAFGEMYGVDICSDTLMQIDPVTAAATPIGSIGFDANYAQDMDFEEISNTLYLAAFNNALGQGELRVADVTTGNTSFLGLFPNGNEVDSFGIAIGGSGDASWLSEDPDHGSLSPGESTDVDILFDTSTLTQTGVYTAVLHINGDFLYQIPPIPVVMHVSGPPVTVPIDPDDGGFLLYTDPQGNNTTVEVPPAAVNFPISLELAPHPVPGYQLPGGYFYANHAFDLDAHFYTLYLPAIVKPGTAGYQPVTLLPVPILPTASDSFIFQRPITVTIEYSDQDLGSILEDSLVLFYWDGEQWLDAVDSCPNPVGYTHDLVNNKLILQVCHLSKFGMVGN